MFSTRHRASRLNPRHSALPVRGEQADQLLVLFQNFAEDECDNSTTAASDRTYGEYEDHLQREELRAHVLPRLSAAHLLPPHRQRRVRAAHGEGVGRHAQLPMSPRSVRLIKRTVVRCLRPPRITYIIFVFCDIGPRRRRALQATAYSVSTRRDTHTQGVHVLYPTSEIHQSFGSEH